MWKDKSEYSKLLNHDYTKLKKPIKTDLLKMVYTLFYIHNSSYNAASWYHNIIKNYLNLSKSSFDKLFIIKARSKTTNLKSNKLLFKSNNALINKMSEKIYQVKI
jgi:hypothetical protein